MTCIHTKLYVTDSVMRQIEVGLCPWCLVVERDALAAELAEVKTNAARNNAIADEMADRCHKAEARVAALEAAITGWMHEGRMQTFGDRERMRAEMASCLPLETPGVKSE